MNKNQTATETNPKVMKVKSLTSTCRVAAAVLLTLSGVMGVRASNYPTTVSGYNPLGYWRFNEVVASPALNKIANSGSLGSSADGYVVGLVTNGQTGIVGKALRLVNGGGTGNCGA